MRDSPERPKVVPSTGVMRTRRRRGTVFHALPVRKSPRRRADHRLLDVLRMSFRLPMPNRLQANPARRVAARAEMS